MLRTLAVRTGGLALLLALASGAFAQEGSTASSRDITHLGGSTAFHKPSLTTVASLNRMGGDPRVVADVLTVLNQAGAPGLTDRIVAALTGATTTFRGGLCVDATPADGTIVECDVQPGQELRWMAYRPTGGTSLGVMTNIRWGATRSFPAFLFRVTADNRTYTFLLPKVCGNLTLMSVRDVPMLAATAPPPAPPAPAPPPPPPAPTSPPAPIPPPAALSAPSQPPVTPAAVKASPFFFDLLAGKERRVRPVGDRTTTDGSPVRVNAGGSSADFAQCSPLVGIKVGLARRFESDWELAGAAGIAFSLIGADDKVREHEVLVDVEANKYLRANSFVGTGLSLWDVTHRDTFTPAWMGHVGLPLGTHPTHPVHVLIEGRVFFDQLDDVRNDYQFWAGVRVHL